MYNFIKFSAMLCFISLLAGCDIAEEETVGSRYYRIVADYTVKDTGEEIHFDYIVVCGASVFSSAQTTSSVEHSLFPDQMIYPTSTGEAVGIRSLNLCADWTWSKTGRLGKAIPDDLMTFAMWYPDANALGFAIGYESDLAYESPYSRLEFHGANAWTATHEDWKNWRAKALEEWQAKYGEEPVGGIPGPWGMGYLIHGGDKVAQAEIRSRNQRREPVGSRCRQYAALDVSEELRQDLQTLLPETNQSFWPLWDMPEVRDTLSDYLSDRKNRSRTYGQYFSGGSSEAHVDQWHELGVRRSGGTMIVSESSGKNLANGGGASIGTILLEISIMMFIRFYMESR